MLPTRPYAYVGAFMNVCVHVTKGGDMKRSGSVLKRGSITGFLGAATVAAKVIQDPKLEANGKDDCGESDAV
jgi:hypothetical protein